MNSVIDVVAQTIRTVDGNHDLGAGALAERLIEGLQVQGFAVVKLPDMEVDQDGYETWPVDSSDREACVKIRRSDGRIGMDSVSHPFNSPERAISAAAGLIAAAQHAQEKNDGE